MAGNNYKLVIAIVKKGLATKIVSAAQKAGAQGGTIVFGRGSAERSVYESILGIDYEPEKEVTFIAVKGEWEAEVLNTVAKAGQLRKPGNGIGFVLDLIKIAGVVHQMQTTSGVEVASMPDKLEFDLIVTIVNRGFALEVVEASKKAGAEGGTILNGRGSGIHETAKIFGFPIEPEKDIVLTLIPRSKTEQVLQAITEKTGLEKPGKGIAFVLSVEKTVGICHLDRPAE